MDLIDAKTIIQNARVGSEYIQSDYVMNIYRGCSHGCIYCYARSEFYEKTPRFDDVRAKKDALRIIRDELRRKKKGVVLTGGVSDPYCPEEAEHRLTRNALELMNAFGFGAGIITKSALVTRDADILSDISGHSPATVNFSITCADDALCSKVEPRVSLTGERFKAIEFLSKKGIVAGVLMDPVIPYITDSEENVREMVKKAKHHGAFFIYISTLVTMADVQREHFLREAEKFSPGITSIYREKYKTYYRCNSPRAKRLWNVFVETCETEGIRYEMRAVNHLIRSRYQAEQLTLGE